MRSKRRLPISGGANFWGIGCPGEFSSHGRGNRLYLKDPGANVLFVDEAATARSVKAGRRENVKHIIGWGMDHSEIVDFDN